MIRGFGEQGVDFIALGEWFGSFGVPESVLPAKDMAEEVPGNGPIYSFLAEQAREFSTHITATILERDGGCIYNCGVIIDRRGELLGKYRKTHPAPEECALVTAGDCYPVMETEGVRCGILTCFDLNFPEAARCLAIQDVDIIFWPNLWGAPGFEAYEDALMRARASESLCFLVSSALVSGSDMNAPGNTILGRSCVVNWKAEVVAEVGRRIGGVIATIDLDEDRLVQAPRCDMLGRHRRAGLYGGLVEG